ncbi:MAG: hypothetical protein ACLP3C_21035 [Mycobacterium sp.]|uniref:hypothetical protein n=1 Tax=Mycobacterium sp. TaxID=1785 RepID=UPI003F98A05D
MLASIAQAELLADCDQQPIATNPTGYGRVLKMSYLKAAPAHLTADVRARLVRVANRPFDDHVAMLTRPAPGMILDAGDH